MKMIPSEAVRRNKEISALGLHIYTWETAGHTLMIWCPVYNNQTRMAYSRKNEYELNGHCEACGKVIR